MVGLSQLNLANADKTKRPMQTGNIGKKRQEFTVLAQPAFAGC